VKKKKLNLKICCEKMDQDDLSYTTTQFFQKTLLPRQYENFVLGADVGGTITNIAIAGIKNKEVKLLFSLDFETQSLPSFLPALQKTLEIAEEYSIHISKGCIGAAGIVASDHSSVDLTNIPWGIDVKDILKKTQLETLLILNDFQVLGYSLNTLSSNDDQVIPIRKTKEIISKEPRILLGAGTGFGKTILRYDTKHHLYHAYESEGGHADIPIYNDLELDLIRRIQKKKHPQYPVSYEDLLSGNGLVDIYEYLRSKKLFQETKNTKEIDDAKDKPFLISKYRLEDDYCKETFRLFRRFYARCAKNLALDSLANGGVFIAGGIAIKNKEMFLSNEFKNEFNQSHLRSETLKKIPLYLLSDYYLSIKGACFVAAHTDEILETQIVG
jgi:glucokinase